MHVLRMGAGKECVLKVKIVQVIIAPDNSAYQGVLLGLGSDGVIYHANNDSRWHVYFPCEFASARAEEVMA